jgi:hypothetical protein
MNVDVEIYIKNIINFFRQNPNDLLNLIPKELEEDFYSQIKIVASENVEKGNDPALTKKQMIDICVYLNKKNTISLEDTSKIFQKTEYGVLCLN